MTTSEIIGDDSIEARVARLEESNRGLSEMVDTLSRVLQRIAVAQQMAAAMPQIAAAMKSQMETQLAAPGGWDAYLSPQDTPPV